MRKIVSLALTLALLLTMAACSGTPAPASPAAPAEPASPSGSDPAPGEPGAEPVTSSLLRPAWSIPFGTS